MGRRAAAVAILLLGGCTANGPGAIRPPSWLVLAERSGSILRVSQSVSFAGPRRIRVCRRIENVSPQPVLIRNVEPEGNNYQELLVHFYDRRGEWIALPRAPGYHPSLVPPPPPADAHDVSIYKVMPPGAAVENCAAYEIEPGFDAFQTVTYYEASVSPDLVPTRARARNLILTRRMGLFASQPCFVEIRRRRIDCSLPPAPGGA